MVVVNCQCSVWKNATSGLPQVSALGPILFVIFINGMADAKTCCMKRMMERFAKELTT